MPDQYIIPTVAWTLALGIGVVATVVARSAGRHFKIVDTPDGYRKVHKEPIPITGGYAILVTLIIGLVGVCLIFPSFRQSVASTKYNVPLLAAGVMVSFGMGVWDDLFDLRPRYKLLFQLVAALLAYYAGFGIHGITGPFGGTILLHGFSLPVTLFWFLGCMNAINLLDGLDGLAGGVGFFAALTLALIGAIYGNLLTTVLAACLCGAILAFLIFNFNPATIFLGDGGSMLIGFSIAAISLIHNNKAETTVALAIPFIALGLPVFDTALAMLRRWSRRIPIAVGDRKHLHHVLLELGLSQRKVVVILYTICVVLGGTALLLTAGRNLAAALMLGAIGVAAFFGVRFLGLFNFNELKGRVVADIQERSKGGKASAEVHKVVSLMEGKDTLEGVWERMHGAFRALELDHACFEPESSSALETFTWRSEDSRQRSIPSSASGHVRDKWSLFLNVHQGDESYGTFEVWKKGEEMPIRDTTMLINELRHALGTSIQRVQLAVPGEKETTTAGELRSKPLS